MKTSYYNKYSRLPQEIKDKYYSISISNTTPSWCKVDGTLKDLYPYKKDVFDLKDDLISEVRFKKNYIKHLENDIDMDDILDYINFIEKRKKKEVMLLCYEKSDSFCHRHILAEWIEENYGIEITEY